MQIELLINKTLQSANLASKIPTNTSNLAGLNYLANHLANYLHDLANHLANYLHNLANYLHKS